MRETTPPLPEAQQPLPESISEEEAERIAAKLDTASRIRKYLGPYGIVVTLVAATFLLIVPGWQTDLAGLSN